MTAFLMCFSPFGSSRCGTPPTPGIPRVRADEAFWVGFWRFGEVSGRRVVQGEFRSGGGLVVNL